MKKSLKQLLIDEKQITISNFLTLFRIILTPIICCYMLMQHWTVAWSLFSIAALTDLFDGFLARILDQQTFLGACLDPIADKILVLAVFFTLAVIRSTSFSIPLWFVYIVLLKDIMLVTGVIALYFFQGYVEVQPTRLSKLLTFIQMLFIAWVFACHFFHWLPFKTYYSMIGVILVLVLACLIQYLHQAWQVVMRLIYSILPKDI